VPEPVVGEPDPAALAAEPQQHLRHRQAHQFRIGQPGPPAPPPVESSDEAPALKARVEALEAKERELVAQVEQERERALRALADLDNARKRSQRDKDEVVRYGLERVLKDLLPVIDNLDRAIDLGDRSGKWEGLAEGVRMTRKLLEDTLARQGLKAFSARGKPLGCHPIKYRVPIFKYRVPILQGLHGQARAIRCGRGTS